MKKGDVVSLLRVFHIKRDSHFFPIFSHKKKEKKEKKYLSSSTRDNRKGPPPISVDRTSSNARDFDDFDDAEEETRKKKKRDGACAGRDVPRKKRKQATRTLLGMTYCMGSIEFIDLA